MMRFCLLCVLLSLCSQAISQVANDGDFVVVRGALKNCIQWSDRVLGLAHIEGDAEIELLGIPNLKLKGLSSQQILRLIKEGIAAKTGNTPKTLQVSVIGGEHESIFFLYLHSLRYEMDGKCPLPYERESEEEIDRLKRERIESEINKIRPKAEKLMSIS